MNKNLLIGVALGLTAYYFLFQHSKKKCNCQDAQVEPATEKK